MKTIVKLFLIMILVFGSLKANAVVYKNSDIKNIIAEKVANNYKEYTDADLSVQVVALPFQDLNLPDGRVTFVVNPSAEKFMARDLEKVFVYVDEKLVKTFNAPIVVKAYKDILVASKFINIGHQINRNNVIVKRVEISNTLGHQLDSASIDNEMMAKKAFREGEVLDKRFVKQKPDVLRQSTVTVYFNTNNLMISTEAIALSDGVVGDYICLINKNYNRTYKGKIIGENKVLIQI